MKVFLYLVSLKNSTETNPKIDDFLCCLNSLGLYHKEGKSKAKAHVVMRQCQCWIFPQHLICWCQSVVLWMDLNQHCWPFLRIGHPFWVRLRRLKENVHSCLWSCSTRTTPGFARWSWTCLPCLGVS